MTDDEDDEETSESGRTSDKVGRRVVERSEEDEESAEGKPIDVWADGDGKDSSTDDASSTIGTEVNVLVGTL